MTVGALVLIVTAQSLLVTLRDSTPMQTTQVGHDHEAGDTE
jgi:hypothetical protein